MSAKQRVSQFTKTVTSEMTLDVASTVGDSMR